MLFKLSSSVTFIHTDLFLYFHPFSEHGAYSTSTYSEPFIAVIQHQ